MSANKSAAEIQSDSRDIEADIRPTSPVGGDPEKPADDAVPAQDAQLGVQKIEAVTLSWSKLGLIALLVKYVTCLTHQQVL